MENKYKLILKNTGITTFVFFIVSLPQIYMKTNSLLEENNGPCPTYKSKLLHTLIFAIFVAISIKYFMKIEDSLVDLIEYSLKVSLLYFFISSNEMYNLTNGLANGTINIAEDGCPTFAGMLVHTIIFSLILIIWNYKKYTSDNY
jgi:hypothetical protein